MSGSGLTPAPSGWRVYGKELLWVLCFLSVFATRGAGEILTIASYNPENIWDAWPENTPGAWSEFLQTLSPAERSRLPSSIQYQDYSENGSDWHSPFVLKAKARNFLKALKLSGYPDIVGIQELESSGNEGLPFDIPVTAAKNLKQKLAELGYHYLVTGKQEESNPVSVTTAFVSKIPLEKLPPVIIPSENYSPSARDIQVVRARIGNTNVVLFNAHFKSRAGGITSENQRMRASVSLRQRILSERRDDPDVDLIVLGDLNSHYYEALFRELGATGNEILMTGRDPWLYNLWYEKETPFRWENSYDGELNTLSHILISDTLYDHQGLQYVDGSFRVIGQEEPAKSTLLGADGQPFRWQIDFSGSGAHHTGQGFSDHLPLVGTFKIMPWLPGPDERRRKVVLANPGQERDEASSPPILLNQTNPCHGDASFPLLNDLPGGDIRALLGKCVSIDISPSQPPLPFQIRGPYDSVWVSLPSSNREPEDLGLRMLRAWDWRPNLDDSRVSWEEAHITPGTYRPVRPHPRSGRCFQRQVFQGAGGSLRKASGRLGISEGKLQLFIASRESRNLILENLPPHKENACPF